jgi:tetratricopeptide (TPR) repeat protein
MQKVLFLSIVCLFCFTSAQGQTAEIEQAKQATLTAPTNSENYLKLAFALEQLAVQAHTTNNKSLYAQYSNEAADYFQLAIAVEPNKAETYQRIGLHYMQCKHLTPQQQSGAAIQYLQQAEALKPNTFLVLDALSKAYSKMGLQIKATEMRARAEKARG